MSIKEKLTEEEFLKKIRSCETGNRIFGIVSIVCFLSVLAEVLFVPGNKTPFILASVILGILFAVLAARQSARKKELIHEQMDDEFEAMAAELFGEKQLPDKDTFTKEHVKQWEIVPETWNKMDGSGMRGGHYHGMRFVAANLVLANEYDTINGEDTSTTTDTKFRGILLALERKSAAGVPLYLYEKKAGVNFSGYKIRGCTRWTGSPAIPQKYEVFTDGSEASFANYTPEFGAALEKAAALVGGTARVSFIDDMVYIGLDTDKSVFAVSGVKKLDGLDSLRNDYKESVRLLADILECFENVLA